MDVKELEGWLVEGLDDAQATAVRAALNRPAVQTKAAGLRQQAEYDAIQARANEADQLRQALDAVDAEGNPVGFRAWYKKFYKKIEENDQAVFSFEKKYGLGSFATYAATGSLPGAAPTPPTQPTLTATDVQREVDKRIQENYAPRWSSLLTDTGTVVQKHMYAKRTNPIDFKKLGEIAATKNGDLMAAYDEWDKPEREATEKKDRESEIGRRVKEELQKRGGTTMFPAGADSTPSSLHVRTKAELDKFDREAMKRDLAQTFMTGEAPSGGI